jgi:hypothetical protein
MDERVTELELHSLALDSARALDHHVPWINEFFKERAQLGSFITRDEWERAIRDDGKDARAFTITIKDSSICVVMLVGRNRDGGGVPYKSELYLEDCISTASFSIVAGSKQQTGSLYSEALRKTTLTPLMLNQWISALESFIFEYLRVTGHFYTNTFSNLFHLALIDI